MLAFSAIDNLWKGASGPGGPEPQPDARACDETEGLTGRAASERSASGLLPLALGRAARRASRSSTPRSSRRASRRRRRLRPKGGGKTDVARAGRRDAEQVELGPAADPQRLRRGAGPGLPRARRPRRDPRRRRQRRQRQRRRPASRGCATRSRCSGPPPRSSASTRLVVAVAETGKIGVPLPIDSGPRRHPPRGRRRSAADGGAEFSRGDHDHRPLARSAARVRCDGVTALRPGEGRRDDPAGLRDDALLRPDRRRRRRTPTPNRAARGASTRSFERITVDGQMSTNDTVFLQASGESGAPLPRGPARRGPAAARDRDRRRRRGRDPGRAAGSPRPPSAEEAERVARAIANSPLVKTALFGRDPNWGRIAQAAGMALAGEELEELGLDHIDAAEFAGEERRGRDRAPAGPRRRTAPTSGSRTSATSTCGSTRSTRPERTP